MIYPKALKLKSGDDLLNSLTALALNENKSGYVLSVVGDLSTARFQCLGQELTTILESHLEIIALNGLISPKKCHLHISLSDKDCKVWSGHLKDGTKILKGADILIGFLDEQKNKKELSINEHFVEIFILPDCPWSSRAVRMLRTLQIRHDVMIVRNDDDFKALNKRSNYSSFPQIFINGEFIGGYSELAELHSSGRLKNS